TNCSPTARSPPPPSTSPRPPTNSPQKATRSTATTWPPSPPTSNTPSAAWATSYSTSPHPNKHPQPDWTWNREYCSHGYRAGLDQQSQSVTCSVGAHDVVLASWLPEFQTAVITNLAIQLRVALFTIPDAAWSRLLHHFDYGQPGLFVEVSVGDVKPCSGRE